MIPRRAGPTQARPWKAARLLLGVALAGGLLCYLAKDLDWRQLVSVARTTNVGLLLVTLTPGSANLATRALRWHVLLEPGKPGPLRLTFWIVVIGYLGNLALPMRAGDLGRAALAGRSVGKGGSFALATTVAERVIDMAVLLTVGSLIAARHPGIPGWLAEGLRPVGVATGVVLMALLLLPLAWGRVLRWAERWPMAGRLLNGLDERWLGRFLEGLATTRQPTRMVTFLGLTAAIWLLDALGIVIMACALGASVTPAVGFLLLAALGISAAVPITPGQIGVYQFVVVSVVESYGMAKEPALALGLALQALNYLMIGFWGMLGVLRLGGKACRSY